MIYLDSSALVKLALTEPESEALARWLAERADQPLVSSALHRAEVPRAVWHAEPGALPRSYRLIKRIARVALTADVLDNSATLPPQELGAAQAIHLSSALALKRDLTAFVAYDKPLLAAARDAGASGRLTRFARGRCELPGRTRRARSACAACAVGLMREARCVRRAGTGEKSSWKMGSPVVGDLAYAWGKVGIGCREGEAAV